MHYVSGRALCSHNPRYHELIEHPGDTICIVMLVAKLHHRPEMDLHRYDPV